MLALLGNRRFWTALGLLLLTAAAVRLCFLGLHGRGFWWDEVATWHDALSAHRNPQEAPLNDWLNRVVMGLLHRNDDFALHVAGAWCGALTVPAAFFLGTECGGLLTGLVAASLALLSPTLLHYAQEARPYPLLVLVTTLAMTFAIRLSRSASSLDLAGFAVFAAASAATHLVALPFVGALAMSLGLRFHVLARKRGSDRGVWMRRLLVHTAIITTAIALGSSWILTRPPFASVMTGRYTLGLATFVRFVLLHCGPRVADATRPLDRLDLTLAVYAIIAGVGAVGMLRSTRGFAAWLLVCAPLATLCGLYLQLGDKSSWPWFKYGTPAVVPFLTLVATGLTRGRAPRILVSCLGFVLVAQHDIRTGMRGWIAGTAERRGGEYFDAARAIEEDPRFVGTIFAPQKSVFGDESDRLIASYALARRDALPAYFAPWYEPLREVEWQKVVGQKLVPLRTERLAGPLPAGQYAVFLGWDSYRGCAFLSPSLRDPTPPVTSGTFITCLVSP